MVTKWKQETGPRPRRLGHLEVNAIGAKNLHDVTVFNRYGRDCKWVEGYQIFKRLSW